MNRLVTADIVAMLSASLTQTSIDVHRWSLAGSGTVAVTTYVDRSDLIVGYMRGGQMAKLLVGREFATTGAVWLTYVEDRATCNEVLLLDSVRVWTFLDEVLEATARA